MKTITVYTDGSCNRINRLGGIGSYIKYEDQETIISKGYSNTTVSRMELIAIIETLRFIIDKNCKVIIHSDSQYTVNSINKSWVFNWETENFNERKNADLWKIFLIEYRKFRPQNLVFKWVKGHNGLEGNELADICACYSSHNLYEEDRIIN